ncbi:hypothetical protein PFISCL1PPCAC_28171, partial [Pristionchus fissidentatus]
QLCKCVETIESKWWKMFTPDVFEDEEEYYNLAITIVAPVLKEKLISALKLEYGDEFERKYAGWNTDVANYPEPYKSQHVSFRAEVLRYCWEMKKLPIIFFNLSGNYNSVSTPAGRRHSDCSSSGESGEQSDCVQPTAFKIRSRAWIDENGTFRMGSGLTTCGIDGVPTRLTGAEMGNPVLLSCDENCDSGGECRQNITSGCRFPQILHIDPDCGLDMRAGEDIPRGHPMSVMSGKWIDRSEEDEHDARMFFGHRGKDVKNFTFTCDVKKNEFYTYNHACLPNMMSSMAYIGRDTPLARPILISRCKILAGERLTWHYNPSGKVPFPCRCGAGELCCNPDQEMYAK